MTALDRDAIAAVDTTGQLDEVLGLAEHLRDALWRVDSSGARAGRRAGRRDRRRHGRLGRRAARLALAALGPRLTRPLVVADGYALPGWAGPVDARAVLELLGNTEETLAAYDDARRARARRGSWPRPAARSPSARARDGVPVIPIPGGFQPRAAIGYSLVARAGGGGAGRRRAVACATRSRRPRRWPRRSPRSGARTAPRTARPSRSRARCTAPSR